MVTGKIAVAFGLLLLTLNSHAALKAIANEDEKVKIEPELTVADNKLKPKISFNSRQELDDDGAFSIAFDFSANSGIDASEFDDPVASSEDIISQYIADGGNMEFNLSFAFNKEDFFIGAGPYYSLLTTDAVSTKENSSSIISVDAEIYGLNAMTLYKFNESIGVYLQYSTYNSTGEGKSADFSKILDNGEAFRLGVEIPLSSNDDNAYILRFERAKHSEVDKAIFRVSISKPFNFN